MDNDHSQAHGSCMRNGNPNPLKSAGKIKFEESDFATPKKLKVSGINFQVLVPTEEFEKDHWDASPLIRSMASEELDIEDEEEELISENDEDFSELLFKLEDERLGKLETELERHQLNISEIDLAHYEALQKLIKEKY